MTPAEAIPPALKITHHKGDPCPSDLFAVTPPEAFGGAWFDRDVEVTDTDGHYPYALRYSASDGTGRGGVYLEIDPAYRDVQIDGRGASFTNIDAEVGGIGVRIGPPK